MFTCLSENDPKINHGLYAGLYKWWSCLEKAQIAQKHFNRGVVVIGSLKIYNKAFDSTYSFEYNPPFEFHAWVQDLDLIYDYSLIGCMEIGKLLQDERGPILDREPEFLCFEKPKRWTKYEAHATYAPNS